MIVYSLAKKAADRDDIFQLRFRVACLERGMQPDAMFPTGRDQDEFDACAIHAVARHFGLMPVGAARLVPETPLGLPLERTWFLATPPTAGSAELSKLAISRPAAKVSGARNCEIVRGLLRVLSQESRLRGIQHWYLQLTEGMKRLLSKHGVHLTQVCTDRNPQEVSLYVVPVRQLELMLADEHENPLPELRRGKRPAAGADGPLPGDAGMTGTRHHSLLR